MTKKQMARKLAVMLSNGDKKEEARIYKHHMKRTVSQVKESLSNWIVITNVSEKEIALHCDVNSFIK